MVFGYLTNFWEKSETVFLNFKFFCYVFFFLSLECNIYLCFTYSTLFVAFSSLNLFLILFLFGYSLLSLVVALLRLLNFYFPTFFFFFIYYVSVSMCVHAGKHAFHCVCLHPSVCLC